MIPDRYENHRKWKSVSVVCDRCHKTVHGLEYDMGTSGFYRMNGHLGVYRESNDESVICDEYMQKNKKYRKDYGLV